MQSTPLSSIDRKILLLLQHNADLSAAEIAEKVELSQSPCWRRIHRMQEEGLIDNVTIATQTDVCFISIPVQCAWS